MSQKRERRFRQLAKRQDKLEADMRELRRRQLTSDEFMESLKCIDRMYQQETADKLIDARHRARVERRNAEMFKRLAIGALIAAIAVEMLAIGAIYTNRPEPETASPAVATKTVATIQAAPEPVATRYATMDCGEDSPEPLGEFKVTHYCPCSACCGEWADGITATGTKATEGRTVAVDPDVIPYGSKLVVLYEDGTQATYVAEDRGGAIKGNRLDVYMDSHDAALAGGVKTAEVYLVKE